MCLGIPGRVVSVWGDGALLVGSVDFAGAVRDVCLSYVPDVQVGQYVIVHMGFAINTVDETEVRCTQEILTEITLASALKSRYVDSPEEAPVQRDQRPQQDAAH